MSALTDAADQFRRDLLASERAAATRIVEQYLGIYANLRKSLDALTAQIDTARQAGDDPRAGWLYRQARYQALLSQTTDELSRFAQFVEQETLNQQRTAVGLAQDQALQLTLLAMGTAPLPAQTAIRTQWNRLPRAAVENLVGMFAPDLPLAKALAELKPEGVAKAQRALVQGVALGKGLDAIARDFQAAMGTTLDSALRTTRTAVLNAKRQAQLQSYQANSNVVDGWTWHAALDGRTCPACVALHGTFHPLTEEFFKAHWQCVPGDTIVSGPKVRVGFRRWYSGRCVELTTASGNRLTCTVNHPVLTSQGWVAAGLLHEGDDVVSSGLGERPSSPINPDEYQEPSRIEDIWRALERSPRMLAVEMPTAAEDFHGDGLGSDVHEIRADSSLLEDFYAAIAQPASEQVLSRRDFDTATLTRLGDFDVALNPARLVSACLVSGGSVPSVLFGSSRGHHETVSFETAPDWFLGEFEALTDSSSGNAERLSERVFRFASAITGHYFISRERASCELCGGRFDPDDLVPLFLRPKQAATLESSGQSLLRRMETSRDNLSTLPSDICLDRLLEVRIVEWEGHVYNLSTRDGWYSANGIITHNCRCAPLPHTKSWEELGFDGIPGTRPDIETGVDWFNRQDEKTQLALVGPAKFEALKAGDIQFHQLATLHNDAVFGEMFVERSLRSIVGADEGRRYLLKAIKAGRAKPAFGRTPAGNDEPVTVRQAELPGDVPIRRAAEG